MYKRLKTIHKYYNDLEYNRISKEEALENIFILSRNIKGQLKNISPLERYNFIITQIKANLSIFQSACEHIDIAADIIQVLNEADAKILYCIKTKIAGTDDGFFFKHYVLKTMTLVYSTWKEDEVHLFLENNFLKDSIFDNFEFNNQLYHLKMHVNAGCNEMILLQDSDLYAVIDYLMITRKLCLNKIWVQEQIQEKFLSLLKKNCSHLEFPIHVFRFKEDLLTTRKNDWVINITSIWSENIVAAKNLAFSLHKEIVYINTHMSIYSIKDAPQNQLYEKAERDVFLWNLRSSEDTFKVKQSESIRDNENYPIHNLFYNGTWKSVNTYVICKGGAWPSITYDDVKQYIDSANKGFEIWSAMSYNSRLQVLSNFAFTLECNGKFLLANVISKLIKGSYLNKLLTCYESRRIEITIQFKPMGIIFLKEDNIITLFTRLTKILIAGNSVIILYDANSCNLIQYCIMLATTEIPPGVINMLPSEGVEDFENFLFHTTYANYISQFFMKGLSSSRTQNFVLKDFSILKQIIVSIK